MKRNNELLASFTEEKINEINFEIRKGIDFVEQQGFKSEDIYISMPSYFLQVYYRWPLLNEFAQLNISTNDSQETFFMGHKVNAAFENFIVVYAEDMPLFMDVNYYTIDLK